MELALQRSDISVAPLERTRSTRSMKAAAQVTPPPLPFTSSKWQRRSDIDSPDQDHVSNKSESENEDDNKDKNEDEDEDDDEEENDDEHKHKHKHKPNGDEHDDDEEDEENDEDNDKDEQEDERRGREVDYANENDSNATGKFFFLFFL